MAKIHKYRPRTKHLNVKLHHFRSYVDQKEISMHKIDTKSQPSDMLTKPLNESNFVKFRKWLMGWYDTLKLRSEPDQKARGSVRIMDILVITKYDIDCDVTFLVPV